jgi:hypothetical protein
MRTAKKLLPLLLPDRKIGLGQRLEAFLHLTGYMVHPLMFFSFVLACIGALMNVDVLRIGDIVANLRSNLSIETINQGFFLEPRFILWGVGGLLIMLCTTAVWIPPFVVLKAQHLSPQRILTSIVILFFLGFGVSLSNTIEVGKALLTNKQWEFKRTPKYAIQFGKETWQDKGYQVPLDLVSLLEFVLVCLGIISIILSIWDSNFGILVILVPYTVAYAFVFALTILQSREEQKG